VSREKTMLAVSLCPLTNMWCPHTREPTLAIARLEKAIIDTCIINVLILGLEGNHETSRQSRGIRETA
jgi:hypothetical protein